MRRRIRSWSRRKERIVEKGEEDRVYSRIIVLKVAIGCRITTGIH